MDVADRRDPGEIAQLLDLIGEHESAFAYDWRSRFGLPLEAVFDGRMSWAETWHLVVELAGDPSSRVGAALADFDYPVDRSVMILADLFDLTLAVAPKRKGATVKPYPRPWVSRRRTAASPALSQEQIRAALAARGHNV